MNDLRSKQVPAWTFLADHQPNYLCRSWLSPWIGRHYALLGKLHVPAQVMLHPLSQRTAEVRGLKISMQVGKHSYSNSPFGPPMIVTIIVINEALEVVRPSGDHRRPLANTSGHWDPVASADPALRWHLASSP